MINVIDREQCTGCHACFNTCPQNCISMESDKFGFLYPVVEYGKCTDCDLCKNVCPIIHRKKIRNEPKAYACMNRNERVRLESSSGGIFTLIAELIINKGGIVFGAKFDEDFSVVHNYAETSIDLKEYRGSKYVQSKIGESYKQAKSILKQGRQVLFTGTPCQVGGLKSYLGQDYDNLFCIDIVCHGVPSPKVWTKYVSYRENCAGAPVQRIAFRNKDEGWKRYSVSFSFENDTEYRQTLDKDLFMRAFLRNICLRPSCYACNFKTLHRESDITLADFWGIQNVLPEMDDDKGTSLVFVNSIKGEYIFNQVKDNICYKEVDINEAVSYNSAAIISVKYNPNYEYFFNELNQLPFGQLVKKFCSDDLMVFVTKKLKLLFRTAYKKFNECLRINNVKSSIHSKKGG